jgi:aminoglycoside 2''-phosphotransferase
MNAANARTKIRNAFPDIDVITIVPFGAGWANTTWLVNDMLVFRFPRNKHVAEATLREMAMLPILRPTMPVAVPDYRYAAPHAKPCPFGGYTLVPGTPLNDRHTTAHAARVAAGVARFLTALHRFPVASAQAHGVLGGTTEQWRTEYGTFRDRIVPAIASHVFEHEQRQIAAVFEAFLQDDRHFAFTPVLLHRDLVDEHILVDGETAALTGVIDFEDISIGDPAFDFTGIMRLGPGVLAAYRGPVDDGFAERIRFYDWLRPLHEMQYGIESGLRGHIERGLARLRSSPSPQS